MARDVAEAAHRTVGSVNAAARPAEPRLVFIHIPKCAGSAVARAIRRAYFPVHRELLSRFRGRPGYAYDAIPIEASYETARSLGLNLPEFHAALLFYAMGLPKNGFISGHVPFSRAAADAFGDEWQFITVLREPISRFMSEHFYNRFKTSQYFRIEEDLEPYLDTADARRTSAQLTNFLTGRRDEYAAPTTEEVESAIDNLRRFAVVGFLENMDRFADDMAARFGRRPAIPHTNRNPAPAETRKREIDPVLRERIAELSAADVEIYRRAQQMFGCGRGW
jgi:hypothetical protein